jgi:hypothetical protein
MIIENQSVLFMQKRSPKFEYFYFELFSVVSLGIFLHIMLAKKTMKHLVSVLLLGAFIILGVRAIRGIPIFGLFFVPLAAGYYYDVFDGAKNKVIWPALFLTAITLIPGHVLSFYQQGSGLGLVENINLSARFVKDNNIKGPIFNNYDIGGYLIYHFYPDEKVFVDNRPEAYSVEFFEELYVPAQEDEEKWQQTLEEYDFNIIYFYRRDATPWAQPFLITRIRDPEWTPVYVDNYVLVLIRNSEQNKEIIDKFIIPEEVFVVT